MEDAAKGIAPFSIFSIDMHFSVLYDMGVVGTVDRSSRNEYSGNKALEDTMKKSGLAVAAALLLTMTGCPGGNSHNKPPAAVTKPAAPTGVTAIGGDGQVTVSWAPVPGAATYNLYWSLSSGVTISNGTKSIGVVSPYITAGRPASTTYYYVITAVNDAGESPASGQVSATTSGIVIPSNCTCNSDQSGGPPWRRPSHGFRSNHV